MSQRFGVSVRRTASLWTHLSPGHARPFATRARRGRVTEQVVNVILQPGAPEFESSDLPINMDTVGQLGPEGGEVNTAHAAIGKQVTINSSSPGAGRPRNRIAR